MCRARAQVPFSSQLARSFLHLQLHQNALTLVLVRQHGRCTCSGAAIPESDCKLWICEAELVALTASPSARAQSFHSQPVD